MAEILQGDVKVPGIGKMKKKYIFIPAGLAVAYVAFQWYRAGQEEDPEPGADGFYNTDLSEMGLSTGGGRSNVGGNTPDPNTDGTREDVIDTNAEWTNKAAELLGQAGYDAMVVYAALGEFLARRALDKNEATIARAAIAAAGMPPVGRPWSVIEEASSGTGTLPAPSGLKVTATTHTSITLDWSSVAGAGSYQIFRNGASAGTASGSAFNATGLAANTTYKFSVAAIGTTGKSGPKSGEVSGKTKAAPVTPKPTTPSKPSKPKIPPYREVIAKRGDTISEIAARYGKSWRTVWDFNLKYRNPATVAVMRSRGPDKIFSGTRIWVPR